MILTRVVFAAALALLVSLAGTGPVSAQTCEPVGPCGDVDDSGAVLTTDALKVLRKAVGQAETLICQCEGGAGSCEADLAECSADRTACVSDLNTCEDGFSTCSESLADAEADVTTCQGELASCDDDLSDAQAAGATCGGNLTTCSGNLSNCLDDLSACQGGSVCGDGDVTAGEDCDAGSLDGETCVTQGFAGHCDWRLPTILELRTITVSGCGNPPCVVDPVFLPTRADQSHGYWTSSSVLADPETAWSVRFLDGAALETVKTTIHSARAVRGGF